MRPRAWGSRAGWLALHGRAAQHSQLPFPSPARARARAPARARALRSLFEKDKLLFAFSLAVHIGMAGGTVQRPQLSFLLTGGYGTRVRGAVCCVLCDNARMVHVPAPASLAGHCLVACMCAGV